MIEMLVVIAIIAIIAGLVLAGAGAIQKSARTKRVQTELATLVTAIENYKTKLGFYPPDNPSDATRPPLFYELTGTSITLTAGTPTAYTSGVTGETLTPAQLTNTVYPTVMPNAPIIGFANASDGSTPVQNFLTGMSINGMTGKLVTAGVTNTFLGVQVKGPLSINTVDQKQLTPWSYVAKTSTHSPTNNPGTFDLWVDITLGGKNYRVSNWSKDPQPL